MLEKDKLRKADIFSGSIISLFGLWIISQAVKMPMKDSWGGVQNVWFVHGVNCARQELWISSRYIHFLNLEKRFHIMMWLPR